MPAYNINRAYRTTIECPIKCLRLTRTSPRLVQRTWVVMLLLAISFLLAFVKVMETYNWVWEELDERHAREISYCSQYQERASLSLPHVPSLQPADTKPFSLRSIVPHVAYISLLEDSNSEKRRHLLLQELDTLGLDETRRTLSPGVFAKRLHRINSSTWIYTSSSGGQVLIRTSKGFYMPSHASLRSWQREGTATELACTLAHLLAAMRLFRVNATYAMVLEDDVSFELIPQWRSTGLKAALESLPDDWTILKVGFFNERRAIYEKHLRQLAAGFIVSPIDSIEDWDSWGAFAYMVHRRGLAALLDAYWPGGSAGPLLTLDELAELSVAKGRSLIPKEIDLRVSRWTLSESVLYTLSTAPL